jgi:hypothetical protein
MVSPDWLPLLALRAAWRRVVSVEGEVMSIFGSGAEKREFGRRQTQLHAWISIPGRPKLACMVSNLSVAGALLTFDKPPAGLPFCFKLTIEATKFETACEIRHNRSSGVGVEFVTWSALKTFERQSGTNTVDDWMGTSRPLAAQPAPRRMF